jgi:hypothetical protein
MKVWREVHGVSIRRATILTTPVTVMEMALLVVIEKTEWKTNDQATKKMLSIYTWKSRPSGSIFSPDKLGVLRGIEKSPDQWGGSNSDEGLKKRGAIVVITPARNQSVSQQCRINTFIPWRGKSTVPFWEERQSKVWETVHKWKV